MSLLGLFRCPSVKSYTGISVPWTSCREARSDGSSVLPDPLWGFTSRGIVLDLSRQAQRILTPWGGLTLGYRLSFPGYQDKEVPEPITDPKAKKPAHNTAWPATPAGPSNGEEHPLFFELCKAKRSILALEKRPNRCHFRVAELNGRAVPKGEVRAPRAGRWEWEWTGPHFAGSPCGTSRVRRRKAPEGAALTPKGCHGMRHPTRGRLPRCSYTHAVAHTLLLTCRTPHIPPHITPRRS